MAFLSSFVDSLFFSLFHNFLYVSYSHRMAISEASLKSINDAIQYFFIALYTISVNSFVGR